MIVKKEFVLHASRTNDVSNFHHSAFGHLVKGHLKGSGFRAFKEVVYVFKSKNMPATKTVRT